MHTIQLNMPSFILLKKTAQNLLKDLTDLMWKEVKTGKVHSLMCVGRVKRKLR